MFLQINRVSHEASRCSGVRRVSFQAGVFVREILVFVQEKRVFVLKKRVFARKRRVYVRERREEALSVLASVQ